MAAVDIAAHLAQWGLSRFPDEDSYYAWQRQTLSGERLRLLRRVAQAREEGDEADREFYDLAASPDVLPVLYSQRYDYYHVLGPVIADALEGPHVLDVGCGIGILTTWYATRFPNITFLGIDRSLKSIEVARRFAQSARLENVSFRHGDVPQHELSGTFQTIVSTQALFQSESDPGLPSRDWTTFARDRDQRQQRDLEHRTGIGPRLDWLLRVLAPAGRVVFFEKAVHLGRRVLLQRALEARGWVPIADPRLLTYAELGESVQDGPLYVMKRGSSSASALREDVQDDPQLGLYRCRGTHADFVYARVRSHDACSERIVTKLGDGCYETGRTGFGLGYGRLTIQGTFSGLLVGTMDLQSLIHELVRDEGAQEPIETRLARLWPQQEHGPLEQVPLYENHSPVAAHVRQRLPDPVVLREQTDEEADGRRRHIEHGRCAGNFHYLYWANTFDQRQIVIVEQERGGLLAAYYEEAIGER